MDTEYHEARGTSKSNREKGAKKEALPVTRCALCLRVVSRAKFSFYQVCLFIAAANKEAASEPDRSVALGVFPLSTSFLT
jgi:hypothetical protein